MRIFHFFHGMKTSDKRVNMEVFDSSIPTSGVEIDGYDRFDVSATWAATERMEIWVAMDNATSTSYAESVGFNAPRNLLRAGFRVQI